MTLPGELRAVFLDVGGPVYDDGNFVAAVVRARDDLRAEQGRGPVDRTAALLGAQLVQRPHDGGDEVAVVVDGPADVEEHRPQVSGQRHEGVVTPGCPRPGGHGAR